MARQKSIWKTEKYTTSSGKEYQRYVLDSAGNKVLRDDIDPKTIDPELLKPAAKSAKPDPKRKRKPARRKSKRIIPDYMVEHMRNARALRSAFHDGRNAYIVIIDEKYVNGRDSGWMVVRISKVQSDKYIFYNLRTQEWKPFDSAVDKPGRGNSAIIWPEMPKSVEEKNEVREAEIAENPILATPPEKLSYYMRKKHGLSKRKAS